MKRLLFIILAWVLCLPCLASCTAEDPYELVLTVYDSMPSCVAVQEDCFYGFDSFGNPWRIFSSDTEDIKEGGIYAVTVSSKETLVYPMGYPSGWNPKYEGTAIEIEPLAYSEFVYMKPERALLTLLSDEHLKDMYDSWNTESVSELSKGDENLDLVFDILDRQNWLPLTMGSFAMDAKLDATRTLISEMNDSTPLVAGESAELVYLFDLQSGRVVMDHKDLNTDKYATWCILSEGDLAAIKHMIFYYKANAVSAD